MLSSSKLYNIDGKKIKRAIHFSDIEMVSKNVDKVNHEIVFHVTDEPDYRFQIEEEITRN